MADAEPTIRYTVSAGKPVVEVGGTWTVFSLRGIRRKAEKALQAAGTAKAARVVDASGVKRLDTAGGAGNPRARRGRPGPPKSRPPTRPTPTCSRS